MTAIRTGNPPRVNSMLDIVKFIMAILIVGIHTEPFGFNVWLDRGFGIITRLCVPFFFVTSSYLYWNRRPPKPMRQYVFRLLILYVAWVLIYLPLGFQTLKSYDFLELMDTFLWSGYRQMWYLNCSIIGFLIVYALSKWFSSKTVLLISFVFLFLGCCMSTWRPLMEKLLHLEIPEGIGTRNGLFYAFPYMAMGKYIAEHPSESGRKLLSLKLGLSAALLVLESFLFVVRYHTSSTILWISVFPMSYYLFRLLLTYSCSIDKNLSRNLRNMATLIYLTQSYFTHAFSGVMRYFLLFSAVLAAAILVSWLILWFSRKHRLRLLTYLY